MGSPWKLRYLNLILYRVMAESSVWGGKGLKKAA